MVTNFFRLSSLMLRIISSTLKLATEWWDTIRRYGYFRDFQKYLEDMNLKKFTKCDNLNPVIGCCQGESCLQMSLLKSL